MKNGQVQVVMMLIDHDADVHIKNEDGDCPLDIAARFNREEVVSFLLNHDISVTKSTRALREAARLGRNRIVQLLLDMGADVAAEVRDMYIQYKPSLINEKADMEKICDLINFFVRIKI